MGIGRPFQRGNTIGKGRPVGSRNNTTVFQEALEGGGVDIVENIKRQALKSNPTAMRLCMDRLVPTVKAPNARFTFGPLETAANLTEAVSEIMKAIAQGQLSAQEGESLARIIDNQRKNLELELLEARITALEEMIKKLLADTCQR